MKRRKEMEKELIKEIEYLFYEPTNMMELRLNIVMDSLMEVFSKGELKDRIKEGVKEMDDEGLIVLYNRIKEEELWKH